MWDKERLDRCGVLDTEYRKSTGSETSSTNLDLGSDMQPRPFVGA